MASDLRLLQTFVHAARHRSMKRAAEELYISPGAISQRIRKLEEQSGHRFFERTGSGVELTVRGKELFQNINDAFLKIEATSERLIRASNHNAQSFRSPP